MERAARFAAYCAVALLLSQLAVADEVTFAAARDNTIYEDANGVSNGIGEYGFAGKTAFGLMRRMLIGFDIAGEVPVGATIDSVELKMYMSMTISGPQATALHRVLADWGESTSNAGMPGGRGAISHSGDASWMHTFYEDDFWAQPGGDYAGVPSGSAMVGGGGFYRWASTPDMVADAQAWLDHPNTNFGWEIIGNESAAQTAKRFNTREHENPALRPSLTVNFMPVPEPATAALLALAALYALRRR